MNTTLNSSALADVLRNAEPGYTPSASAVKSPTAGSRRCYFDTRKAETLPKPTIITQVSTAQKLSGAAILQSCNVGLETNGPSVIYVRRNGQAVVVSDDILIAIAVSKASGPGSSGAPALPRGLS